MTLTPEYSAWTEVTAQMREHPGVEAIIEKKAHDYIDRVYGGEFVMRGNEWTLINCERWKLLAWAER